MSRTTVTQPNPRGIPLEVADFLRVAEKHGFRPDERRGAARLYHGSWPILVSFRAPCGFEEMSVPLRDISTTGLAFQSSRPLEVGCVVTIKFFSSDSTLPRTVAEVRHVTLSGGAYLVGCSFGAS